MTSFKTGITLAQFYLIMMIWGDKYNDRYVNFLFETAQRHSKGLLGAILVTDRERPNIHPDIEQKQIPDFFNQDAFFRGGYPVKLSIFDPSILPQNATCIYLDLDTLIVGALDPLAALVPEPNAYYMLPPGNLFGFGRLRRCISWLTGGAKFACGNSSIMVYHSGTSPNIAEEFQALHDPNRANINLEIDDRFISWFAQKWLRALPNSYCVMFRREFMSRFGLVLSLKRVLMSAGLRRRNLVAVTFNDEFIKPVALCALTENETMQEPKGRKLIWSEAYIGSLYHAIKDWNSRVN